jgi:hypothetical protein
MVAKVYADRDGGRSPASGDRLTPDLELEIEGPPVDNDVETEVQDVAMWFEALPPEWQRYFDHEAQIGRQAYGPA